VVDMGHDREIADFCELCHGSDMGRFKGVVKRPFDPVRPYLTACGGMQTFDPVAELALGQSQINSVGPYMTCKRGLWPMFHSLHQSLYNSR